MSKVRTNIEIEDVHVQAIMDRLNVRTKGGRPGPAALGWATHDPPGSAPNAGGPRHRRHAGRPCASRDPVILADTSTPQSPSTVDAVGLESPRAGRSRLFPGVNDSGRRFFSITTKISRRDPRPCPHEYHPPIVYTPRSTRCSPPVTTWRPPW